MNFLLFYFKYFWAICAAFWIVQGFLIKLRMSKTDVEEDLLEQKKVVFGYCLFFMVPTTLLQVFQMLGNYNSPFYLFYRDYSNIFYWLAVGTIFLAFCAALCVAIKFENIEKYTNLLFRSEMSQKTLIFFIAGLLISNLIAIFVIPNFVDFRHTLENVGK